MLLSPYVIKFEMKIIFCIYKSVNIIGIRLLHDVVVVVHVQVQVHPVEVVHISGPSASRAKRAWTSFALSDSYNLSIYK
jgi:hypothetical protein